MMFEIGSRVVFLQVSNPFQWVACLIELVYSVHMIHDDRLSFLVIATVTNPSKGFTLHSFTECGRSSQKEVISRHLARKKTAPAWRLFLHVAKNLTPLSIQSFPHSFRIEGFWSFYFFKVKKLTLFKNPKIQTRQ